MGKTRVLGKDVQVFLTSPDGLTSLPLLQEVDRFSAKNNDELKKSRPLGETTHASHTVHMGWDLEFEAGKNNWNLSCFFQAQDEQMRKGGRRPFARVVERVTHLDGSDETWVYEEVSLFGYNEDIGSQTDEIKEKFSGYAKRRVSVTGSKSELGAVGADGSAVAMATILSGLTEASMGRYSVAPNNAPQNTKGPVG